MTQTNCGITFSPCMICGEPCDGSFHLGGIPIHYSCRAIVETPEEYKENESFDAELEI